MCSRAAPSRKQIAGWTSDRAPPRLKCSRVLSSCLRSDWPLRTQIASVNVFCNANRGIVCLIRCGAWGTYREVWICALAHYGGLCGRGGVHRDPLRQQLRILGRGRGLCHSGLLLKMGFESNTMTAAPSGRSAFESPPARAPAAIRFPRGDSGSHGRRGSRTGVDPRLPRGDRERGHGILSLRLATS